ncbi:hypothetical protein [Nocardia sp. BMG51109]|uniref:hypothetical protein n=1 Tax=Nocardia sp. BMG51109 TaxID=1056816 RepID=UPI0004631DCC|nr:hypothetical protein [Nocardia sp. BMG51109]
MQPHRHVPWVAAAGAATVWTAVAACSVAIGLFAAADTRCGSTTPRVDMAGGWWVIATLAIWTLPFALCAFVFRSRWAVPAAWVAVVVDLVVVAAMFANPMRFCW